MYFFYYIVSDFLFFIFGTVICVYHILFVEFLLFLLFVFFFVMGVGYVIVTDSVLQLFEPGFNTSLF